MIGNKKVLSEIRGWIVSIVGAIVIASVVNSKVLAKVQVEQISMQNTLKDGQQLILDKLSYNFSHPKKGDIIIFLDGEEKGTIIEDTINSLRLISGKINSQKRLVKRVIGEPGDEVNIKDGYVYVNGEKIDESYVKGTTNNGDLNLPIKVLEDQLFVLGDNREFSKDSREFGLINYNQVEGKAIFRIYPFDEIGSIN